MSVQPADFDGDGGMDLMVVVKNVDDSEEDEKLEAFVLWGEHDQVHGKNSLLCIEKSLEKGWHHKISLASQPLVMDGNGDYIADIFAAVLDTETANSTEIPVRAIYTYATSREQPPTLHVLKVDKELPAIRRLHSNSFVDINGDGNADLLVSAGDKFELWENRGKSASENFAFAGEISLPGGCLPTTNGCVVGQSALADFDLDGKIDMVFPVCFDGENCEKSALFFATLSDMWPTNSRAKFNFSEVTVDMKTWKFDVKDRFGIYDALTPRVGDIDLDGFPDLLLRVTNPTSLKFQTHLLLNVDNAAGDEIVVSDLRRGFVLSKSVMDGIDGSVMAAFYDLYENGVNDIIAVTYDSSNERLKVGAFTNVTQDSIAYFVKVIVLSGVCYRDCRGGHVRVPYGTNCGGQTICYRTQRLFNESMTDVLSCAAQMTQTAHTALQLPYTIFGLGMSPNFIDHMFVNVTNATDASRSHAWPQIIPNSQMYIIPHPADKPSHWDIKLFITPSRSIVLTAIALFGTCVLVIVIILFLHWRERKVDLHERLQETHRFYYDAM